MKEPGKVVVVGRGGGGGAMGEKEKKPLFKRKLTLECTQKVKALSLQGITHLVSYHLSSGQ